MLCKRGLSRHAVSVCLSVCVSVCLSVTFVDSVKMNKYIFNFFNLRVATPFSFFPYQTTWQYSDGNLTGASNAGGVGRNRNSEPILASLRAVNRSSDKCNRLSSDRPWRVYTASPRVCR